MKILLLNPAVDFDKQFGTLKKFFTPIPSLGLAYIGAVLHEDGFEVVGQDSFIACHTVHEMCRRVMAERPDVLGVSLLTPSAPLMDRLLPHLRKVLPGMKIVLGNIHASKFSQHYIENRLADHVVHHEGEMSMLELMRAMRDGRDMNGIAGTSHRDPQTGREVRNPNRPWIPADELDTMPYPRWDIFPVDQFKPDIRLQGREAVNEEAQVQALPILCSRGCPFNCTFCSPVNTIGNKYRLRSPESIVDEMEHFHERWGVTSFYAMDLTFPISESKGLEFCDHLIERNLPIGWSCETRVSGVTLKLLKRMKESGCVRVDYGIECGNQKMLDSINKKFTIRQVRDAMRWTREADIETEGLFIIGLPDETPRDTRDTIEFALELDPDHIKLNLFVPYPGSDLWDMLEARGELSNMDFNEYTSYPSYTGGRVPYVPRGRSHAELVRLQRWGMRRAMFRPRVITRELKHFKRDKLDQYVAAVLGLLLPDGVDGLNRTKRGRKAPTEGRAPMWQPVSWERPNAPDPVKPAAREAEGDTPREAEAGVSV